MSPQGEPAGGSELSRRRGYEPRVRGQQPLERASTSTYTIIILLLLLFVYLLRSVLLPFIFAGAIAYVVTPLVNALHARTPLPRWAAAALAYIGVLALIGIAGVFIVPSLVDELRATTLDLPTTIERAMAGMIGKGQVSFMGQRTDAAQLTQHALEALRHVFGNTDVITSFAVGGFEGAFGLVLTVVLIFYFLAGGPNMWRGLIWLVPPAQRPLAEAMWQQLDPVLIRYFAGLFAVVCYATGASYLGLAFGLHLRNALVLAVLTGFLEMIPMVGPGASAIIAGLAALQSVTGVGPVIAYVVYVVALRFSIDQIIGPVILGRAGRVQPILIIFCFLIGGALFGMPGVILAIPAALTIRTVLATLYAEPLFEEDHGRPARAAEPQRMALMRRRSARQ